MRSSLLTVLAALSLAACSESPTGPRSAAPKAPAFDANPGDGASGAVFTQTNAAAGNAVVAFARAGDGSLTLAGTFSTGGNGIGGTTDPLASQYSLILDGDDAKLLFVVNAGSNTISRFRVDGANLTLLGTTGSHGTLPVSLAVTRHTLYVLNAGSNNVAGFDIGPDGSLTWTATASAQLSAGASAGAAVRASRDGQFLAVTEKGSRTIDVYQVGAQGALGQPVNSPSSGISPFGFDFVNGDQIAVSEAGSGAATLYDVGSSATLNVESASVSTNGQAAPCWLIATTNARFAFTANAGSGTISGYGITNGSMQLLVPSGVSGSTGAGSTPLDLDLSRGDHFLYVLESGAGRIGAFAVSGDGTLASLAGIGGLAPSHGYQGLAAY